MTAERHPGASAFAGNPSRTAGWARTTPETAPRRGRGRRPARATGRVRRKAPRPRRRRGRRRQRRADDPEQQVQQDLEELAAKAEKADEYLLLAQRTQADFENYRKRAARDAALAQDRGIAKLAKELLPAIDNLDRARLQGGQRGASRPLDRRASSLCTPTCSSALQRVGVEPFSPAGEQFDPQLHEAVAQQPIEGAEPGTVAEVFQQGFRLGDTVLRPARVLVAG